VVSDYWVDHREYILLIDLRIVISEFVQIDPQICSFPRCESPTLIRFPSDPIKATDPIGKSEKKTAKELAHVQ
jgi:hypothetical protein